MVFYRRIRLHIPYLGRDWRPSAPIAFTGPKLAQPGVLGGGTYLQLPRAPYGVGGSNISLPGSSSGESTQNNSETPTLGGSTFGQLSPYRGVVRMSHYISGAGSADPGNEYIEISVAQNAGFPIDISGWALSSDVTGNIVSIPKGTEVPTSGTINAAENIVLTPVHGQYSSPDAPHWRFISRKQMHRLFQHLPEVLSAATPELPDTVR